MSWAGYSDYEDFIPTPSQADVDAANARRQRSSDEAQRLNAIGQYIRWQGFCYPVTLEDVHPSSIVATVLSGKGIFERGYDGHIPCERMRCTEYQRGSDIGLDKLYLRWVRLIGADDAPWIEESDMEAWLKSLSGEEKKALGWKGGLH